MDYLPKRIERSVLKDYCSGKVDGDVIHKFVDVANMVRKLFREGRISGVLSTRDLKMAVANLTYLLIDEVISLSICKFIRDDRKAVLDAFEQHFGAMTSAREVLEK